MGALRVPPDTTRTLPAHVYYHHELIDCAVWTVQGEQVGTVASVDGEGEAVRLVVATAATPLVAGLGLRSRGQGRPMRGL